MSGSPCYRHGVPPRILARLERILAYGAVKHSPTGPWHTNDQTQLHVAGALRHLGRAGRYGELVDDQTGERHLLHAAARLIFLVSLLDNEPLHPTKESPK